MVNPQLIVCGSSPPKRFPKPWSEAPQAHFEIGPAKDQVHVRFDSLHRRLRCSLSPLLQDLIDLAAYVYTADQWVVRGGPREFEYGHKRRRQFRFEVPVQCVERWNQPALVESLQQVLGFLSDDDYEFHFRASQDHRPLEQRYLFSVLDEHTEERFEETMLFSGGLDSLGGAVQEILMGQRKVILVSHRPVNKVFSRQKELADTISRSLNNRELRPLHIALEVNKGKRLGRDSNQRSRSFLFAAIAASVARLFDQNRIRFYENGVTSLNLPVSPEVLGGRASRTTHPKVLAGYAAFFTQLFEKPFGVENPFQWKTKTDILTELKASGFAHFCAATSSCAETRLRTLVLPHCGLCSQCVDRRLTALAAGLDDSQDRPEGYEVDVLTGPREGPALNLLERYYASCLRLDRMASAEDFVLVYPEVLRTAHQTGISTSDAIARAFRLYQRHARQVLQAVATSVSKHASAIVHRQLDPHCLVALAGSPTPAIRSSQAVAKASEANPGSPRSCPLILDEESFSVHWGRSRLFLGNSIPFRLLRHFRDRPGIYLSLKSLREDVWGVREIDLNTVQRTVSALRTALKNAGIVGVIIDGKQPGYYRFSVAPIPEPIST